MLKIRTVSSIKHTFNAKSIKTRPALKTQYNSTNNATDARWTMNLSGTQSLNKLKIHHTIKNMIKK